LQLNSFIFKIAAVAGRDFSRQLQAGQEGLSYIPLPNILAQSAMLFQGIQPI
jgi:hypothetical protein